PRFGPFAEDWYSRRCDLGGKSGNGLSASGRADLRNQLDRHLLPWFAGFRLDEIDVEEVERYAAAKRRAPREEGGIGSTYLNKTLQTLRAVLRDAVRYGRISRNVAEDVRVVAPRFKAATSTRPSRSRHSLRRPENSIRRRARSPVTLGHYW